MRCTCPSACPAIWMVPVLAMIWMAGGGAAIPGARSAQPSAASDPAYVLDHKAKRIDGTEEDLAKYRGKVLVIVNVASRCGFTSQYEGLEKLYREKRDAGLVVLAFPSNDFNQEPGENAEIAEFCRSRFGVSFPLFEKISVKGEEPHPLYADLIAQPEPIGGAPKWNFTKFLVDREGFVAARFDADRTLLRTPSLEPAMLAKIAELLGEPPDAGPDEDPQVAGS